MSLFSRLFRRGEPGSEEAAEEELPDAAGAAEASSAAPETVEARPTPEPVAASESAAIAPPASRPDAAQAAPSKEATPSIEAKQPPPAAQVASAKAPPTAPTQKKAAPPPPASSLEAPLPRASSPQPALPRASAPGAPRARTSSPGVIPAASPKPPTKAAAPKPRAQKAAEAKATTAEAAETSAADVPAAEATGCAPSALDAEAKEAPALGAPPTMTNAEAPDPAPAPASSAAKDAEPAAKESGAAEAAKPEALPPARVEAEPAAPPAPDPRKRFDDASRPALRPLVQLMLELRSGSAPGAWARRCLPALSTLRPLASELNDASIGAALDATKSALEAPGRLGRATIEGELREGILRAYATLAERVSAAVDIEEEHGRRDPVVVDALLLQVDGVHKAALDKIYAAGWSSTERFLRASPEELDRETGVGRELAERIVAAFRAFRDEFPTVAPDPLRAEELRRLGERLDRLRGEQSRFERACSEWSDAALIDRRALRKSRGRTLQSIHLLLARMGEVEKIGTLERAPYPQKIAELAEYLRAEKSRATAVA